MPSQLPADTNLSSPQIKLLSDWNDGLTEMNVETTGRQLHKDFRRSIHPRSLDQPEQSKEEMLKEISELTSFADEFHVGPCHSNLLLSG